MTTEQTARQRRIDEFLRSNKALEDSINDTIWTFDFQQVYRTVRDINVHLSRPLIEDLLAMGGQAQPQQQPQQQPQAKVNTRVSQIVIKDAVSKRECCPITLAPLKAETSVCVAPCYHVFETSAIDRWLKTSNLCPHCREACFR